MDSNRFICPLIRLCYTWINLWLARVNRWLKYWDTACLLSCTVILSSTSGAAPPVLYLFEYLLRSKQNDTSQFFTIEPPIVFGDNNYVIIVFVI